MANYSSIFEAIAVFSLSLTGASIFFIIRGRKNMQKTKIRGAQIVSPQILAEIFRKKKAASDIKIAGFLLLKWWRKRILVPGTTGTVKLIFCVNLATN